MNVQFETLFGTEAGTHDWITPAWLIEKLPEFDLDPCQSKAQPSPIAPVGYTVDDDGLSKQWAGRVYCNPPYGDEAKHWLKKCAEHGRAIALIFARTETSYFQRWVFDEAHAILFIAGRLKFWSPGRTGVPGSAGAPSVLVAYGEEMAGLLEKCDIPGKFVHLKRR